MRLSRPCYDKPHRCPGWAHGGWVVKTKNPDRCDGGYIRNRPTDWRYDWWIGRCGKCDVRVLPIMSRYLDPTWYRVYWWRVRDRLFGERWWRWFP